MMWMDYYDRNGQGWSIHGLLRFGFFVDRGSEVRPGGPMTHGAVFGFQEYVAYQAWGELELAPYVC